MAIHRIEIAKTIIDGQALIKKKKIESFGFKGKIRNLWLIDVYTLAKKISPSALQRIAFALTNPITQEYAIDKPVFKKRFDWAIEISLLPGVTDNVGNTAKELIEDLLKEKFNQDEGVYFSSLIIIEGSLLFDEIKKITNQLLNPLIQTAQIKDFLHFKKEGGMTKKTPQVRLSPSKKVITVNLDVSDEELLKIGKEGILDEKGKRRGPLALDLADLKIIRNYFKSLGRWPTDIELESLAQMWSEHCRHRIFNSPIDEVKQGLFKTFIEKATNKIRKKKKKKDICVSVFSDNSGAIEFTNRYLITYKIETHNTPSALDPFGGSITGIVGVNRDTIGFGLGAKPIANFYGFCFPFPKKNQPPLYRDRQLKQKLLSPNQIIEGVIEGVNVGGNCSGIPTSLGFVFFDDCYRGKPLVFVGTIGLIPKRIKNRKSYLKKAQLGDWIVMIGGRVGLDGVHGATFSSEALNEGSPATAVQIGDPIMQKKFSDALVKKARDLNLYHSITDNGAGGLSCSVIEMAKEAGGCEVWLEKVPLKYPGLDPWQIWISESQERMTLAVPKSKWLKLKTIVNEHGVEATIIGHFTRSGHCVVRYQKKIIMDLSLDFLYHGAPQKNLQTKKPKIFIKKQNIPLPKDFNSLLLTMISHLNIGSYQYISQQYDHEVQGNSVIKPLQGKGRVNGDTVVIKPLSNSNKGLGLSFALFPYASQIDCYQMAGLSIDTAIRNLIAAGANPEKIALLDNFCWCDSYNPERLYQLKQAVKGCYDFALKYATPFISGKDSMFNDFNGFNQNGEAIKISVFPTLLISSLGIIEDIEQIVSIDFKFGGDLIYLIGETEEKMGGSQYYQIFHPVNNQLPTLGDNLPTVDAFKNKKIYRVFHKLINEKLIASAIAISKGGLAISLLKSAMAGDKGARISLKEIDNQSSRDDFLLFSESPGRILVSISPANQKRFETILGSLPFKLIGEVFDEKKVFIDNQRGKQIINLDLRKIKSYYQSSFKKWLNLE